MYAKYIKRILDFSLSLFAIVLLSPFLLILTFIGLITMKGNPFFTQERVGLNEKIFKLIKFRTMTNERDSSGNLLPDEKRVVPYGKFLRSTSLDELPELFNILKGDIAIIGPRPLLVSYLPYYTETERLRHSVRGGLTVPEVIYGNVTPTWEEQFSYEVEYAKNITFPLDVKILWYTILIIFKRIKTDYGSEVRIPLDVERKDWVKE